MGMEKKERQYVEEFDEDDFEDDEGAADSEVNESRRRTLKGLAIVLGTSGIIGSILMNDTLKVWGAQQKIDVLKEKLEAIRDEFKGITLTVLLKNPLHYAHLLDEAAQHVDGIVGILEEVINDGICIHPLYLEPTRRTIRRIESRFRTGKMVFLFSAATNYMKGRAAALGIKQDIVRALGGFAGIVEDALSASPTIHAGSAIVKELDEVARSLSAFLLSFQQMLQKLVELRKAIGDLGCGPDVDDPSNDPVLSFFIEDSKGDKLAERKKGMKRLRSVVVFSYEPDPEDEVKVWALQQVLYDNGFFPSGFPEDKAVDGDFGRSTTAANEQFKRTLDLGYQYSSLYGDSQTVSRGPYVRKIQQLMANYGYYNGEVDGSFGEESHRAYYYFATAAWGKN